MLNVTTMTVKGGQVQFDNIPEGWGIQVKNYDTGINPAAVVTKEQQEAEGLFADEDGLYYSAFFTDSEVEYEEADSSQLELPIEGGV
jgi:hypothetical protein